MPLIAFQLALVKILNGSDSEFRQVRELAASLQHRPLRCQVAIGSVAERLATNRDVEQVGEID